MGDVRDALDKSIEAAIHLTELDAAAVAGARALADKIDAWDVIVDWALDDLADNGGKGRPAVPQNDNVSLGSFLKYLDQLGLTPEARHVLEEKKGGSGGKLKALREREKSRSPRQ